MSTPYLANGSPAYDAFEDDGITPNAATVVMQSHTGTLDTTGYGSGVNRTIAGGIGPDAYSVEAGPDTSAAAINPFLRPDLSTLPDGYVVGPTHTGPIY